MFSKSAQHYDDLYSWKDYAKEGALLVDLIQSRFPGARRLLDVGCGTGKHLEHLKATYDVEGLDLDPILLELARQRLPAVRFHQADMLDFDLGRRFDVVTCLFGSIGYLKTLERVRAAIQNFRRHLVPDGLLALEPWLSPEQYTAGKPHALFVNQPDVKLARMNVSSRDGNLSILDMHYLRADSSGVEYFTERHELVLLTKEQYIEAFETSGFAVDHDPQGLMGRSLYVGRVTRT